MPFIFDAMRMPWLFPTARRAANGWRGHADMLGQAMWAAGVTPESILEEAGPSLHLSAARQEELIMMDPGAAMFMAREAHHQATEVMAAVAALRAR
eukprot:2869076-Pyramimonas_sp.AAC.1